MLNDVNYFKQTTHPGSSVVSDGTRAQRDSRRVGDVEASSVLMDDMPLKTRKEMDGKMKMKKMKVLRSREKKSE